MGGFRVSKNYGFAAGGVYRMQPCAVHRRATDPFRHVFRARPRPAGGKPGCRVAHTAQRQTNWYASLYAMTPLTKYRSN